MGIRGLRVMGFKQMPGLWLNVALFNWSSFLLEYNWICLKQLELQCYCVKLDLLEFSGLHL